jgi:hypothetical protein
MLIVQLAPPTTQAPQVVADWRKSCESAPPNWILEMSTSAVPTFVRVTICAALVVPTGWLAKTSRVGDKLT